MRIFHAMEKMFPHCGKQPSAEPKPQAKGEREVYSATQSVASERAERTVRQNGSTLWKTFWPERGHPARLETCGRDARAPAISLLLHLSALLLLAVLALPARAQLGPYPIQTKQAAFEAKLVKRDKDMLWVQRESAGGAASPQVGIAVADILQVRMPRPSLFDAVEKIRAAPAATDAQFAAAHAALDKFILQTKSLRDIPGIPADEALLLKGRLYDKKGLWRESTRLYEDILAKGTPSAISTNAQILAGIAYAKGGEYQFAIEYLGGMPLPEEDEEVLSALLFALGDSYFALGNYDNALLSYLPLVVFYPYVYDNEPRGLAAALGCYAKLKEWEPLYRSIQEIQKNYPDTPAAKTAEEFLELYKEDLVAAGQFVDAAKITSVDAPAAPVADKAAAEPK